MQSRSLQIYLEELFSEQSLRRKSASEWFDIFSTTLSGKYSTTPYKINPGYIYRARVNNVDFFNNSKDLWAPPYKLVSKGRCNAQNQSMLYCSAIPTTTFFELDVQKGDVVTIIEYKFTDEISPLKLIGWQELNNASRCFGSLNAYERIFQNHFANASEDCLLIDRFLSERFKTRKTDENKEYLYNITNAIVKLFLYRSDDRRGWVGNGTPSIGLLYPSVQTDIPSINYVFKANEIKSYIKASKVYMYKILEKRGLHFYAAQLTHQTSKIRPDGHLVWQKVESKIEYLSDLRQIA